MRRPTAAALIRRTMYLAAIGGVAVWAPFMTFLAGQQMHQPCRGEDLVRPLDGSARQPTTTASHEERGRDGAPASSTSHQAIDDAEAEATCDPRNYLVLVKAGSKAKYAARRTVWRNSECPSLLARHNITYRFMLAMPAHATIDPNGHNSGAKANEEEVSAMRALRDESAEHGDMEFLPLRDEYELSNLKVHSMLRWAAGWGMDDRSSIVVVTDDEYCLNPDVMRTMCVNATKSNASLYAGGLSFWDFGTKDTIASDGSFAPYFAGALYALSADLVKDFATDPAYLFSSSNVIYAEDTQVGHWVKRRAYAVANPRTVHVIHDKRLVWDVERGVGGKVKDSLGKWLRDADFLRYDYEGKGPPGPGTCGDGRRGNGVCTNGQCCSEFGHCGTKAVHCSGRRGVVGN